MTLNANPPEISLVAPVPKLFASNEEPTPQERVLVTTAIFGAEQSLGHNIHLRRQRPNVDLHNPPYQLGHVCRLWRNVCLAIPEIGCILPPLLLTKRNKKLDVGQHLSTTPASVSFKLGEFDGSDLHPAAMWYFKSCKRWKTVSLQLYQSSFQAITSKILIQMPKLETLHLHIKHKPRETSRRNGNFDAFQNAPALRDVHVECMIPTLLNLPWSQLKSYRERSCHPIGIIPILRQDALSLERLTWIGIHSGTNPLPTLHALVVYRLTHLDLVMYDGSVHTIINMIDMPSLQELRVRDTANPNTFIDITSMLRRSFAGYSMRRLSMYTCPRQDQSDLAELLRRMPHLVELECNNFSVNELKQLLGDSPGVPLVPHLRKFVIYDPVELSLPVVDEIIDQRSHPLNVPLEVVRLVFANEKACDDACYHLDVIRPNNKEVHERLAKLLTDLAGLVEFYKTDGLHGPVQPLTQWKAEVKLNGVLTALEDFEIEDPNLIEVRALSILTELWLLDAHKIPRGQKYNFTDRARALLDAWIAIFRRREKGHRWIRHGPRSFLYLAGDGEWRERQLLGGEYRFVDEPELLWPYEDSMI
ncbi:hypothetical protein NLJ89_g3863 [Agrocybe chaxingu]|uniref:F-box domain-containing protein n=1 Tax=Agrocybe chaxingu TaxID=84603 RepID=A0A9W8MWH0_9AGAR|nr:hypothetical protein NLJ89_g3863 [Agrocybe chaxingu]